MASCPSSTHLEAIDIPVSQAYYNKEFVLNLLAFKTVSEQLLNRNRRGGCKVAKAYLIVFFSLPSPLNRVFDWLSHKHYLGVD